MRVAMACLSLASVLGPAGVLAQTEEELAKQLSNPVASLISVPFQNNTDFGLGSGDDGVRNTLNIQPVIPISIAPEWNLISRTILPVIYQDDDAIAGEGSKFGLGDTTQSLFFSPVKPTHGWIWGVGPVLLLDTATDDLLGNDQWGAGPTFVVLRQDGGWTWGMLANHIWGFGEDESRQEVDATFLQPFLTHTWKNGVTVGVNTESSYDWEGGQWTVPINAFVARVVKIGGQRVQFTLGGRHYAEAPRRGPDWGVRAVVTLLFPK
jgi:hypothetical protein